jgi:hypothetical protein
MTTIATANKINFFFIFFSFTKTTTLFQPSYALSPSQPGYVAGLYF